MALFALSGRRNSPDRFRSERHNRTKRVLWSEARGGVARLCLEMRMGIVRRPDEERFESKDFVAQNGAQNRSLGRTQEKMNLQN